MTASGTYQKFIRSTSTLPYHVRRVVRVAREEGPGAVVKKFFWEISSKTFGRVFDLRHGTDTCSWVRLSELSVSDTAVPDGNDYQPTGFLEFRKLMRALSLPRAGTFIDFGSGKGRVLLMAAHYGFRRVIGVEFSEELCAVARSNVEIYQRELPHCTSIEIVCADAGTYALPDDATVLFLYNPFEENVVKNMLEAVNQSLRRHERPVCVIYNNAVHATLIEECSLFVTGQVVER